MGFIIFLIICAALYAIYKLVVAVDVNLQKNRKKGIVVREPENEEEKQVAFDWKESDLYSVDEQGNTVYLHGRYLFSIRDGQHIDCAAGEYRNEAETRVIEECPF